MALFHPRAAASTPVRRGFRSILVPVNTAQAELPCDIVDLAARRATERRSAIVLVAFTVIPLWEEMDVELPEIDERVGDMGKRARAIAGRYGVGVHLIAPRTRRPEELILAEARRRTAELVVLGATAAERAPVGALLRDPVVRRLTEQPGLRTMFVRPQEAA
jgi:nucleotide-binding universal stress UspA family protein